MTFSVLSFFNHAAKPAAPRPQPAPEKPNMSIKSFFEEVEGKEKSTMAYLEKSLSEIEGEAPSIERVVDVGLNYLGPVLQIALGALGQTALAAEVGPIIAKAQNMLLATSATITDFGATPTAASVFGSVASNLSALLAAGQIKNAKTVAAITKAVSEISTLGSGVATAAARVLPAAA